MSRRGENIYKRKDNRWEGRYIRGYDMTGKPRLGYVYAKSYREVREKLASAKVLGVPDTVPDKKYFDIYCREWLLLCRNRVKESTYVKYHTIVNKHLSPVLGNYLPQNLNTIIIEDFSNNLLNVKGLSPKTVRDILTVIKSVLKYIQRQEDVFPDIEIAYPKEQKKKIRVLTPEEQTRFTEFLLLDMDDVKFGILLALLTGLRIGEICALRWKDINIEERALDIGQTMQRLQITEQGGGAKEGSAAKTKILFGETKSENSKRLIPLTDYAAALCRRMYVSNPKAYVLTGDERRYMEPRTLQYRLARYTAACGLSDVHFHSLRHTFATRCIEVGFEIKSLSEVLGHSSVKVTLDRYVHSSMRLKRENMEKLKAVGW